MGLKEETKKTIEDSQEIVTALKSKADAKRTGAERVADGIARVFGSIKFLTFHVIWFAIWVGINLGLVPSITPFDPFPFGLLTMVVSLEAIVLSIFLLISQSRASKVEDLRSEMDLRVDLITEEELTKAMEILAKIARKNKIDLSHDPHISRMLRPLEHEAIEKTLEKQIS